MEPATHNATEQTASQNDALRENILNALQAFANQRPGIEPGNYGWGREGWNAYRSEARSVTRDLHDFRTLFAAVRWRQSIGATRLQAAFRAYSGRLTCTVEGSRVTLSYCTGQYFATEFRKAACAVLASALWDWTRDECMPEPIHDENGDAQYPERPSGRLVSAGEWLRRNFRREFGARLARRYFD